MYELRAVSKTFQQGSARIHAVRDVDLDIGEDEFLVRMRDGRVLDGPVVTPA
jgi:ABC-type lipoprotein export system ATPase subunit